MMKYQLNYYSKYPELLQVIETIEVKNRNIIRRYLSKKNVIGSATIYSYCEDEIFYYKPRR